MAVYVYLCETGHSFQSAIHGLEQCPTHISGVRRDYRAEKVGFEVVSLRRERERGGPSAVRDLFLPTAKELAGPGDPDGTKAIQEWNDTHDPKEGNRRPMRPEAPKTIF